MRGLHPHVPAESICSPYSVDRLNVADMTAFAADYSARKRRDMHVYMRESCGKCGCTRWLRLNSNLSSGYS